MKTRNNRSTLTAILFIAMALCFSINTQAQSEMRSVDDFNKVSFSLPGTLEIVQGNKTSLEIQGDKEDIAQIKTEVSGKNLKIYSNKNNYHFGHCKTSGRSSYIFSGDK